MRAACRALPRWSYSRYSTCQTLAATVAEKAPAATSSFKHDALHRLLSQQLQDMREEGTGNGNARLHLPESLTFPPQFTSCVDRQNTPTLQNNEDGTGTGTGSGRDISKT